VAVVARTRDRTGSRDGKGRFRSRTGQPIVAVMGSCGMPQWERTGSCDGRGRSDNWKGTGQLWHLWRATMTGLGCNRWDKMRSGTGQLIVAVMGSCGMPQWQRRDVPERTNRTGGFDARDEVKFGGGQDSCGSCGMP